MTIIVSSKLMRLGIVNPIVVVESNSDTKFDRLINLNRSNVDYSIKNCQN